MLVLQFLATGFGIGYIAGMSPGPDTVIVLRSIAKAGKSGGIRCTVGISLGLAVHAALTFAFLYYLQSFLPESLLLLRILGAGYLLFLGITLLYNARVDSHQNKAISNTNNNETSSGFLTQGFLTNLLNPKAIIFFLSIVTQLIVVDSTSISSVVALLTGVILGPTTWFLTLSLLGSVLIVWLNPNRQKAIDIIAGVCFLIFAAFGISEFIWKMLAEG